MRWKLIATVPRRWWIPMREYRPRAYPRPPPPPPPPLELQRQGLGAIATHPDLEFPVDLGGLYRISVV